MFFCQIALLLNGIKDSFKSETTGGPRYSFYLRFRLFAVHENTSKFIIHGLSLAYSRFVVKICFKYTLI